jgi:hypothetical protein
MQNIVVLVHEGISDLHHQDNKLQYSKALVGNLTK